MAWTDYIDDVLGAVGGAAFGPVGAVGGDIIGDVVGSIAGGLFNGNDSPPRDQYDEFLDEMYGTPSTPPFAPDETLDYTIATPASQMWPVRPLPAVAPSAPVITYTAAGAAMPVIQTLAGAAIRIAPKLRSMVARLAPQVGLAATGAALGLTLEQVALIWASKPKRRRRGISYRDVSTARRVCRFADQFAGRPMFKRKAKRC